MASSASLPPSLESSAHRWKYDVFLSFRGPDTRKSITSDLYDRLQRKGIKTFMDDPVLQVGDAISPSLIKAIEESRFAIVVLSRDYASSTWCLEELTKICECMEENNRILPLFYNVEPFDVQYRKRSFGEAFNKHESSGRHTSEKIQQWNDALNKVTSFSGWDTKNFKTDRELAETIVDFVCRQVQPVEIGFTISTGDFEAFEATKKAMDEVMKALKDKDVAAVGVYGMGGVGKTTMVKHAAAQSRKSGIFDYVIIGVVSQSPDVTKIQGTLAEQLGFEFKEKTDIGRAARLQKELMRREKILIILDDVWNRIELSAIGIPSYEELQKCKSKVLLTTRISNVCHAMGCQEKIDLHVLSEEDSWTLFLRNARRSFESTEFSDIARKVAGECKGLPVALIAVARALGDKDNLEEWEKAAQRLQSSQPANPDDRGDVFECIKLSYDYLKDEDHKSYLLLCCLYPEDHDIHLENLFKYAIGIGLFGDAETIEEARGTADSVVKYLKGSSLLLDSEINGCVKMHDVIRDTALNIPKSKDGHGFLVKADCGLKDWPHRLHEGCTAISLMRNEICKLPEEELVCPNLQILLLQQNIDLNEIPEKFIKSLNELRVLDLSITGISSLPQSFSLLTSLQALYLDFCMKLNDISIVGKLKKLEILSIIRCRLKELSREIGHLTNLRILDISGTWALVTIPSKVISKLHKLEEFYMLNCGFKDWGCEVEGQGEETNIGFAELAGLSKLKILQVNICDAKYIPKNVEAKPNWVYFFIATCKWRTEDFVYKREDRKSRTLVLEGATISALPDWFINAVTKKAENLEYYCYKGMGDILMEYDRGRLQELKNLTVYCQGRSDAHLPELINTTRRLRRGPVFKNLEELHLINLDDLKELCVGGLPPESFINLKVFHVRCCCNLGNVTSFLKRLPNLEKLYLNCVNKIEYVFGWQGFEPHESKLTEMHLLGPFPLKSICIGRVPHVMFQNLRTLTFYRCELLESLFPSEVAQCLIQLEDLYIEWCPLLKRIIEEVKKEKMVLPKLKRLVLSKLHKLYATRGPADIECPSLEHLIVIDCYRHHFSAPSFLYDQSSFTSYVSDYFGSTNPVKFNDQQLYESLRLRCFDVSPF